MKKEKGRPSKILNYNRKKSIISLMLQRGFTDEEISTVLDISRKTLHNWKAKDKDLLHTLNTSKKVADDKVEVALFERACGYSHPEDKIFCEGGKVTIVPTIHHYPPDATSMIFWLKNRQPDKWSDRTHVDLGLSENLVEKLKDVSVQELLAKANELIGKSSKP